MKILLLILAGLIVTIILIVTIYLNTSPQLGGKAEKYNSSNFKNNKFQNLIESPMFTNGATVFSIIKENIFTKVKNKYPPTTIKTSKIDKELLKKLTPKDVSITWFGHSSILIKTKEQTILIDPVLNKNDLPPMGLGPKRFPYSTTYSIKDLPKIDVVLITHDHYDHLDMETIQELKEARFLVPLGIKPHLLRWSVNEKNIQEFDWYDKTNYSATEFIFTPTRHFSGRGIFNRESTLWGSWVININNKKIYFSGDSGYSEEFKKIGKKYGPFDLAILENGQYNAAWQNVHMLPKETAQASDDLNAKVILPIHWGKHALSKHAWNESITKLSIEAKKQNITMTTPRIGETILLNKKLPNEKWW